MGLGGELLGEYMVWIFGQDGFYLGHLVPVHYIRHDDPAVGVVNVTLEGELK